jgi:hypothetical protein
MAGSRFMGSNADGVAPAVQLAIFLASRQSHALGYQSHEQVLEMLSDPSVDVAQASVSVGDTSRFGTASIQRLWANRLIAASGKPFVKSAGNYGPWLHGMGEFEMAETVFAVGAYTPRATWLANLGFDPAGEHVLASYSPWGPARDGGLKPDFLALTNTLSEGSPWRWYWNIDGKNYGVSNGTSAAAPHGAGHIALLVSAAKQTGVPHDAFRLRAAIATTAKFLDGVEARAQGHGLVQVSDAWQALQRAQRWTPPSFEIRAPLVGQQSRSEGPERFTGRGLFELSGWKPGQTGQRELIVTRTGGKRADSRFLLRWKGHTSNFRSPLQEVELPLGRPVSIPVEIQVQDSGSYSAILDLIDPQTQLVAGSVLNTVIVADPLVLDGEGLRYERESPRPGSTLFYVDVPAGAAALTVSLAKDATKSDWLVIDPSGRFLPFNPYGSEIFRVNSNEIAGREQRFAYPDPVPGVWQFEMRVVEPRSMEDLDAVDDWSRPMPLSVHIRGWTDQGWTDKEGELSIMHASQPAKVRLHAVPGAPDAKVEPVGLGAARDAVAVLRPGLEPVFFDLQVDPGTASVEIEMDHGGIEHGEPRAHVGLYVFKLPEGERVAKTLDSDQTLLVYYDASFQPRKRYSLAAPPPGRYRVALDPIQLRGTQIEVAYRDVIHHPLFGSVSVNKGEGDSGTATVTVHARPADGRRLYAQVGLFKPLGLQVRALLARQGWFVEP